MRCNSSFEALLSYFRANSIEDGACLVWQGTATGSLGYGRVWYGGKEHSIHRLVYRMFTGEEPPTVRHSCDNPRCWNFLHLKGGTQQQNKQDSVEKDRHSYGLNHGCVKLNEDQVLYIANSQESQRILANEFGVSTALIGRIKRREIWKHLFKGDTI